jgi:hypothetical protein
MGEDKKKEVWDPLSEALGIDSDIEYVSGTELLPPEDSEQASTEISADYDTARRNVINTLLKADDALNDAIGLAKAGQTARHWEVVATMIKTIIDGNQSLLDLSKRKVDVEKSTGELTGGPQTINNTLVVGSTSDLQKLVKSMGVDTLTRVIKQPEEGDKDT